MVRIARLVLLSAQAFVAVTALAGGLALVVGSVNPAWGSMLMPPQEYLEGSPFSSYLIPGMLLILLVAGVHAVAFVTTLSESRWGMPLSAAGGFACLIWIFVQMIYIPFSFLQALYFGLGLVELGVTMVLLGILSRPAQPHRETYVPPAGVPHVRG
jgi:hypothetical protein